MRARVVFIPGIMGSVLADEHLQGRDEATSLCAMNLDKIVDFALSTVGESIVADANPCVAPNDPAVLWGEWGCAHWLFDTPEWVDRLNSGNGIDVPSGNSHGVVVSRVHNSGLLKISIDFHGLGGAALSIFKLNDTCIDPYGPIIAMLEEMRDRRQIDFVIFPYDWRLSNAYNATVLAQVIRCKWWRTTRPEEFAELTPPPEEQVTIIAHSMGGLIARYFVEAPDAGLSYITRSSVRGARLQGHRLVRRVITIGTPHMGAPKAYLSYIGVVNPIEFQSSFLTFLRSQLFLPRVFDRAFGMEVGEEVPRDADIAVSPALVRQLTTNMSSLVEMFPAWDFLGPGSSDPAVAAKNFDLDRDSRPLYEAAYERATPTAAASCRLMRHSGTARRPWQIFQQFRSRLVPAGCLSQWLKSAGVHYHALGETSHFTVTKCEPRTNPSKKESPNGGDGTVPTMSALLTPWRTDRDDNLERIPFRSPYSHDALCLSTEVLETCRRLVSPETPRRMARAGIREVVTVWRFEDVGGLVGSVLASAGYALLPRRAIVSVARIRLRSTGGPSPFAEWFTDGGNPTIPTSEYLRKPSPWPSKPWPVGYDSKTQSIGRRLVVAMEPQEANLARPLAVGGVVFLPESPCQQDFEVLAWNLGERASLSRGVINETHAEVQLVRWIVDRFGGWLDRQSRRLGTPLLDSIEITNKLRGDSPCAMCQQDLRELADWAKKRTDRWPIGSLAWSRLYGEKAFSAVSGPTYLSDLRRTEASGWAVSAGSPRPKI